jgi:hypothetical protein
VLCLVVAQPESGWRRASGPCHPVPFVESRISHQTLRFFINNARREGDGDHATSGYCLPQWILANIGQKADPHIGAAAMVLHRSILLMHFLDPKLNRLNYKYALTSTRALNQPY